MFAELIVSIIFVLSLGGVVLILVRKLPELNLLPQNASAGLREHRFIIGVENKIKEIVVSFEKQIFLHKILSWVKVMTLRVETKVDSSLHKIRKKNQKTPS